MEGDAISTGRRACTKFFWQYVATENWAVRVLPRSGRPAFIFPEVVAVGSAFDPCPLGG
jgi:hypothetical protein